MTDGRLENGVKTSPVQENWSEERAEFGPAFEERGEKELVWTWCDYLQLGPVWKEKITRLDLLFLLPGRKRTGRPDVLLLTLEQVQLEQTSKCAMIGPDSQPSGGFLAFVRRSSKLNEHGWLTLIGRAGNRTDSQVRRKGGPKWPRVSVFRSCVDVYRRDLSFHYVEIYKDTHDRATDDRQKKTGRWRVDGQSLDFGVRGFWIWIIIQVTDSAVISSPKYTTGCYLVGSTRRFPGNSLAASGLKNKWCKTLSSLPWTFSSFWSTQVTW